MLVIDVQGARQVRARGIDTRAIFVLPPSFEVLEQRLRGRSKDSEAADAAAARRRRAPRSSSYDEYDYVVVNDELEPTVVRLQAIIAGRAVAAAPHAAESPKTSSRRFTS